ncbi:peptidylprolyl isomerase PpiC [Aliiglaciecola sp. CAU 1673]|uniref:peptidylprolyl isomerase PpiC n=1 Tax=Aliiglaciecola sp. CAU 1673 TaxID=3032595 RepID=UPI0023DB6B20|nr:peptidylprolyl isomerase PpiC [Aliiglaciecola sp. CAU 1673]MDF2178797.1 peptidylprolyl isomerase PpiC [Aliiglaciecola sp. CAU 1673]
MARVAAALHILVKTENECQELKKKLEKGANFQQLAKQFSTCPSGKKGGDLGEFKQGQMVKAFDKAVFSGPELVVQGPVKTQFGYHLIKVLYKR